MDPEAAEARARRTLALVQRVEQVQADESAALELAGSALPSVPAHDVEGAEVHHVASGSDSSTGAPHHGAAHDGTAHDGDEHDGDEHDGEESHDLLGSAWGAAASSFCFFASGALLPVLPYLFGLEGLAAVIAAVVIVGLALLGTGATVGVLSGASPGRRALRQIAIGYGAAGATYLLGLAFGTTVS